MTGNIFWMNLYRLLVLLYRPRWRADQLPYIRRLYRRGDTYWKEWAWDCYAPFFLHRYWWLYWLTDSGWTEMRLETKPNWAELRDDTPPISIVQYVRLELKSVHSSWRFVLLRWRCRRAGHPAGIVFFNPSGWQPDGHCRHCHEEIE